MDTQLTFREALMRIASTLDLIEVRGTSNMQSVIMCKNLVSACLDSLNQPAEPEITDFHKMTSEELEALGRDDSN